MARQQHMKKTEYELRNPQPCARWLLLNRRGRNLVLGSDDLAFLMRQGKRITFTDPPSWTLRWQTEKQVYFLASIDGEVFTIRRNDDKFLVDRNWRVVQASWELL